MKVHGHIDKIYSSFFPSSYPIIIIINNMGSTIIILDLTTMIMYLISIKILPFCST